MKNLFTITLIIAIVIILSGCEEKKIERQIEVRCENCNGTGDSGEKCSRCGGSGYGMYWGKCSKCTDGWTKPSEVCDLCDGTGRITQLGIKTETTLHPITPFVVAGVFAGVFAIFVVGLLRANAFLGTNPKEFQLDVFIFIFIFIFIFFFFLSLFSGC